MKPNVGNVDRIARAVVGLVLIGLSLNIGLAGWIGVVLLLAGVVVLLTSVFSWCPVYKLLGLSTCAMQKKD